MNIKRTVVAAGLGLGLSAGVGAAAVAAAGHLSARAALNVAAHRPAGHRAQATLNQHGNVKIGRYFNLSGAFSPSSWAKKGMVYVALLYVKGENGKFAPLTGVDGKSPIPHTLAATVAKNGTFTVKVPASFVRHTPGTETFEVGVEVAHHTKPAAMSNQLVVTFVR